jgi:hypothetical protein
MKDETKSREDPKPVVLGAVGRRGSGDEDIVITTGEKNLGTEIGDSKKGSTCFDDED